MFDGLAAAGVRFTAVATITSAASSVETLFTWANALSNRARYLVVKNHFAGDDFGYFEDTEPGRAFLSKAEPIVIDLKTRAREIQSELDNRGRTAAQVGVAEAARRGLVLNGGTARVRAEAYARQIDAALDSARSLLHPLRHRLGSPTRCMTASAPICRPTSARCFFATSQTCGRSTPAIHCCCWHDKRIRLMRGGLILKGRRHLQCPLHCPAGLGSLFPVGRQIAGQHLPRLLL